ncbi:MAG: hypothetical protein CMO74_09855 [Verrucomicrobiales bacterium]|nr:hypothetical protein [Verrucomicrobiales bacterium]|tara:strand:+ start:571 stop:1380 length:810 start_codon:yes stop_codon:yes gene_type:complete
MNTPSPKRHEHTVDPFGAFLGMWRLLWRRQVAYKRLLFQGGLMLGFTLLTWLAIPPAGRVSSEIQAGIFLGWVVGFYFLILMPLTCLSVCGAMVREEVSANTLSFYTTRPLKRAEMFLLFYFGHIAWLQLLFACLTLMLFAVGALRGVPGLSELLPVFLVAQFLALMAWGALCGMLGMAHHRYIVVGIVYGLVVEIGIANIPTNIANLALSHHLYTLLAHHGPLAMVFRWSTEGTGTAIICLLGGTVFFLALGAVFFTVRELMPAQNEK